MTRKSSTETSVEDGAGNETEVDVASVLDTDIQTDTMPADSSAADDKDVEKSSADLLDEVLAAGKEEAEPSSDSKDGEESEDADEGVSKEQDGSDEDLDGEVTDEELATYKPKTRKRVEQLLEQRNAYRELGSIDELKQFKSSHEHLQGLTSYMEDANLSTEEVNRGFDLMRAMKNDPVNALPVLEHYAAQLRGITGEELPSDLRDEVDSGRLTEEHARALSQARAREVLATRKVEQVTHREAETQQAQEAAQSAQVVQETVSTWERNWSESDPDYKAKQPRVMEKIELAIHRNGPPETPQAAIELVEKCKGEVDSDLKQFVPKRHAVKPVTGGSAPKSAREPETTLDVIDQVLSASG